MSQNAVRQMPSSLRQTVVATIGRHSISVCLAPRKAASSAPSRCSLMRVGETPSESSQRVVTVFATVSAGVRGRFRHRPMHHRECGRPTNDLPAAPSRSPGCSPISIIRARRKGMVNATLRLVVYLRIWRRGKFRWTDRVRKNQMISKARF